MLAGKAGKRWGRELTAEARLTLRASKLGYLKAGVTDRALLDTSVHWVYPIVEINFVNIKINIIDFMQRLDATGYPCCMLELKNLTKRYGTRVAVNGLSLTLRRGERFGLLGPNGAGKTTTISMLVGSLPPDSGEIVFEGMTLKGESEQAKRKIGYVPQELALYDDLTALQNLELFGALYGLTPALLTERCHYCLTLAGLTDRANQRVKTFSGGMKRRLNLAIALVHGPELLVLDEPTVGVDPQSRNAIFETLEKLADDGMTLLYTTHYMEEVERLCERIAILDEGQIVAEGSLAELADLFPRPTRRTITLEADETTLYTLTKNGIAWQETTERQSLETVFLHLTGKTLRDG